MSCAGIIVGGLLLAGAGAMAHGGDHGSGYGSGGRRDRGEAKAEPRASMRGRVMIPATLPEVWSAVRVCRADLEPAIASRRGYDVHDLTESIRELTAAMPEMSGALSDEPRGELKEAVKQVKKLTLRVEALAGAKNVRKVLAVLVKLDRALQSIESRYPAGTLPAAPPPPVIHACPMHPEVISEKPGTCPRCGMDLIEKKK